MTQLTPRWFAVVLLALYACGESKHPDAETAAGGSAGNTSASAGMGAEMPEGTAGEGGAAGAHSTDPRVVYLNETSTNWAMSRGYPRGTAFNPHERELNPDTVAELEVRWSAPSESSPLVQHDRRIFASHVESLDAASGTPLWTNARSTRKAVYSTGLLVQTYRGIQGVDPTTGEHRIDIPAAANDGSLLFGPATAKGADLVFPVLFQSWAKFPGEYTSEYRVFNIDSQLTRIVHVDFVSLAPVSLTAGRLYTPTLRPRSEAGQVHWDYAVAATSFDPDQPVSEWTTLLERDADAVAPELGVAVIAGRVFAASASGNEVVALDQKTGEIEWRAPTGVAIQSFATTFDQVVVAGAAGAETVIETYEPASGAPLYSTRLSGALSGQIAVGGRVVYVGTASGELHMIHAETGELLASILLGGVVTDPVVTRGRVFVATGEAIYSLGLPEEALAPEVNDNPAE